MKCSCLKGKENYEFSLTYTDDFLIFEDQSVWVTREGNEPLEEFDLTILNEGQKLTLKAKVNGKTKIKYSDLPGSKECDYDGIYQFIIESCDQVFSRTEAILENIYCAYSRMLISDSPDWDNIYRVFQDINIIEAHAQKGFQDKAVDHYDLLKRFLKKINCKCK